MPFILSYWYMFFACVSIATIAMSAGIGGATFFIPFILLVLKVPIRSAIAIGIFVEIFGFAAGVWNYARSGKIDYALAKKTLFITVPFVILGVVANRLLRPTAAEYVFILALMIFATQLLLFKTSKREDNAPKPFGAINGFIAAIGGLFLGFLSSGLGESNEYNYFVRLRRSPMVTAATSVLVVALSAVVATIGQTFFILRGPGFGAISSYTMLIIYSVMGAIVGAKFGAMVASRVDRERFRKFISILLYAVAIASIVKIVFVGS